MYNTVADNSASAEVACLHSLKLHIPKNLNKSYHKALLEEFIATFVIIDLTCQVKYLP